MVVGGGVGSGGGGGIVRVLKLLSKMCVAEVDFKHHQRLTNSTEDFGDPHLFFLRLRIPIPRSNVAVQYFLCSPPK